MRIKVQFDDNDTVKVEDAVSLKVQDGIYIITLRFKPDYNRLCTEFKKLAPKE